MVFGGLSNQRTSAASPPYPTQVSIGPPDKTVAGCTGFPADHAHLRVENRGLCLNWMQLHPYTLTIELLSTSKVRARAAAARTRASALARPPPARHIVASWRRGWPATAG